MTSNSLPKVGGKLCSDSVEHKGLPPRPIALQGNRQTAVCPPSLIRLLHEQGHGMLEFAVILHSIDTPQQSLIFGEIVPTVRGTQGS
jgi:hypothetical protein